MLVLASRTGWTEGKIRWRLPLSRGLAYYHAARLLDGENCRWPGPDEPLENWLAALPAQITAALDPGRARSTPPEPGGRTAPSSP